MEQPKHHHRPQGELVPSLCFLVLLLDFLVILEFGVSQHLLWPPRQRKRWSDYHTLENECVNDGRFRLLHQRRETLNLPHNRNGINTCVLHMYRT